MNKAAVRTILLAAALALFQGHMYALGLGGGLPWEGALGKVRTSINGPVTYAIGGIGIGALVATYMWRVELSEIMHRVTGTVLLLALGFGAVAVMATLFGATAALV